MYELEVDVALPNQSNAFLLVCLLIKLESYLTIQLLNCVLNICCEILSCKVVLNTLVTCNGSLKEHCATYVKRSMCWAFFGEQKRQIRKMVYKVSHSKTHHYLGM